MTVFDTLITDRTQEDVEQARELLAKGWDSMTQAERAAFQDGLRGAYGPTDMNRAVEAMEHIDQLMAQAKQESVYVPTMIPHAEFDGTAWRRWSDKVWRGSDYPAPALWAAYLANIDRLWTAARRFRAVVLPRYDPEGAAIDAGKLFRVTESVGLVELRVSAVCPPEVTARGVAWAVSELDAGWVAALGYAAGPYPDIGTALGALELSCGAGGAVDGEFTLSAILRYDYEVTAGTCTVRWGTAPLGGEAEGGSA